LYRAWFLPPPEAWPHEEHFGRKETAWALLLPPLLTAILAISAGLFAFASFSPFEWAQLIATREFYQSW
jgi:multicomponent Na+:H+ antiporter subunit D